MADLYFRVADLYWTRTAHVIHVMLGLLISEWLISISEWLISVSEWLISVSEYFRVADLDFRVADLTFQSG